MKKHILYQTVAAVLLIAMVISCKKDKEEDNGPIIKKWNLVRHVDTTVYFNGPVIYSDYQSINGGDYFDFRKDGKLYAFENGQYDTASYTIENETIILQNKYVPYTTSFKIVVSTADSLYLYGVSYGMTNSHDYRKTHYYLNR